MNYRLYTFVAHHYLSPLQCGIQSAHVVGELAACYYDYKRTAGEIFNVWNTKDKTIIVCGASNHKGVMDCYEVISKCAKQLELPYALFCEDKDSMNGMATACGVIVPEGFYDVKFEEEEGVWCHTEVDGDRTCYHRHSLDTPEGQLIECIKSYKLA